MAFQITSDEQDAEIFNPLSNTNEITIPFTYGSTSFDVTGELSSGTLWDSSSCTLTELLEIQGAFQGLGTTASTIDIDGYDLPLTGRLPMTIQVEYRIEGTTCSTSLQEMYSCYQNVSNCMGSSASDQSTNQQTVINLFDPFIQAGAMGASDIPNVTDLAQEMQYQ